MVNICDVENVNQKCILLHRPCEINPGAPFDEKTLEKRRYEGSTMLVGRGGRTCGDNGLYKYMAQFQHLNDLVKVIYKQFYLLIYKVF